MVTTPVSYTHLDVYKRQVIKLSAIVEISKLMKPSEKQIEEARQKRIQAQKEGKDTFEVWDERDDDSLV